MPYKQVGMKIIQYLISARFFSKKTGTIQEVFMSDLLVLDLYQISDSIYYVKNSNMLIKSENLLEIRLSN